MNRLGSLGGIRTKSILLGRKELKRMKPKTKVLSGRERMVMVVIRMMRRLL